MGRRTDGKKFGQMDVWRGSVRTTVDLYYHEPNWQGKEEYFFALIDGKRVTAASPGKLKEAVKKAMEAAKTYSEWGFYLQVTQGSYGDSHLFRGTDDEGARGRSEGLHVSHALVLLGQCSDGERVSAPCHFSKALVPHVGLPTKPSDWRRGSSGVFKPVEVPCCKVVITDPTMADTRKVEKFYSSDSKSLVPFTPERLAWLLHLESEIGKVEDRLSEMLGYKGEKKGPLVKRLDAAVASSSFPLALPAHDADKDKG